MSAPSGNSYMESLVSCAIFHDPRNESVMLMSRPNHCTPPYTPRALSSLIRINAKKCWIVEKIVESTIAGTKNQNNDCQGNN